MVLPTQSKMTLADFQQFAEHADKRFEFIDGDIVEVPSNPYVSVIAARIIAFISMYLMTSKQAGHLTGEGGGFIIDGHVFAPDVAYVLALPVQEGYETKPPLLAVEVISNPHNNTEQTDLRRKMAHYMRAGITVWLVDYVARQVEVHQPDKNVMLLNESGMLTAPNILPEFKLPVKDIFPPEDEA